MGKKLWTVAEVLEFFQIEERFLAELEEEDIVRPVFGEDLPCKMFSPDALEKLRLAKTLVDDMGVNLAGVEVILQMRRNMIEMRKQFDAILEDMARQLQEAFEKDH